MLLKHFCSLLLRCGLKSVFVLGMEPRASWQAAFICLTFTYLVCAHEYTVVCTWIAEDCLWETPTAGGPQGSHFCHQVGQPEPSTD